MIFFALTKPKQKLKKLLILALLAAFLGIFLPGFYGYLAKENGMSQFASQVTEEEEVPGEPLRVTNPNDNEESLPVGLWYNLRLLLAGEEVVLPSAK